MVTVRRTFGDFYEVVNGKGRVLSMHASWIDAELKADRLNRRRKPLA